MTSPEPLPEDPAAPLRDSLRRERAHHDACRATLAAMRAGADLQVVTGEDVSASGADAEVLGYRLRSQAKALRELPDGPLFFGRLDFAEGTGGEHAGLAHHIGRVRISEHPAVPPLALANRLLTRLDTDVPPARSLRRDGAPRVRRADGDLSAAVVSAVRDALTHEGSVGVITATRTPRASATRSPRRVSPPPPA